MAEGRQAGFDDRLTHNADPQNQLVDTQLINSCTVPGITALLRNPNLLHGRQIIALGTSTLFSRKINQTQFVDVPC
jgi:hypothetical protein